MDNSWSYSMFSSAVQCLQKFKYCYIDKISGPTYAGDLIFGSALHSALNAAITGGDPQTVFSIYWESYRESEVQYGRFAWEELNELGYQFIRKFMKMHVERYKVESAEVRLYVSNPGIKFEGTLDFYGLYDGKISLRDFKTAGYNYAKEKEKTALQLNLYAYLAINNGFATPETLGYMVFNKGTGSIQDLTWKFDEKKMNSAVQSLIDYCNLFESQVEHPKNLNACLIGTQKCPYWEKCHGK